MAVAMGDSAEQRGREGCGLAVSNSKLLICTENCSNYGTYFHTVLIAGLARNTAHIYGSPRLNRVRLSRSVLTRLG